MRVFLFLVVLAIMLTACGGGPEPTATPQPTPTATPKPTATPRPTATPTATATPKPTPIVVGAARGWQFVLRDVRTLETIDVEHERIRPKHDVFLVLIGMLSNYTDKDDCLHGQDVSLHAEASRADFGIVQNVLIELKTKLGGIDYPGFYSGQCLDYDASQWSFFVFDVPTGELLALRIPGAQSPLGVIAGQGQSPVLITATPRPTATATATAPTATASSTATPSPNATATISVTVAIANPVPTATATLLPSLVATAPPSTTFAGTVNDGANLRAGPGTTFALIGSAPSGTQVQVAACNDDCSWYQLDTGSWIAASLVNRTDAVPAMTASATSTSAQN